MKVDIESVSAVEKKLSVLISEEEISAVLEQAYVRLNQRASIPGFRPGKVPRAILEKKFGPSVEAEAYEELVRKSMIDALTEHDLQAVAVPKIREPKREKGQGFSYVASVEVKPAFEPKDYKGVSIKKEKVKIEEEQIQQVFKRLQDAHAVLKDREGASKPVKGDFVSLWIQGINKEDGSLLVPNEEPKDQLYEIGGEILHKDVEKAVLKMQLGEASPVTVETKSAKGEEEPTKKEINVRVTLKAIKEKILPSLDDEFAKSVGPFENLKALRERIEKDLTEEMEEKTKADAVQALLEKILKKNPLELPATLVESELHSLMHGLWHQLEQAGIKEIPAEYSEEKLKEKMQPDATRRVHEQLVIEAIATKENLAVSDTEVDQRLHAMAQSANVPVAEFRKYYEKTDRIEPLRFQLLARKTLDFLFSNAKVE